MIKGKFEGVEFHTDDEGIVCKDAEVKEKLEKINRYATMDKGPADGDPEYYFYELLKDCGATDLSYKNEEPDDDRIY